MNNPHQLRGQVPSLGQSGPRKFQSLDNRARASSKPWNFGAPSGFTLVEVLLAMAILGICVTGLLVAVSQSLTVARKARLYDTARNLIARVELEQPLLLIEEFEEGEEEGDFEGGPEGYRWRRTIELPEIAPAAGGLFEEEQDLYKVSTRVSWERRGREEFEEVVSYFYHPEADEDSF
jgi:prepilin-type N-terminal cleavage/methylation domain-containing protein